MVAKAAEIFGNCTVAAQKGSSQEVLVAIVDALFVADAGSAISRRAAVDVEVRKQDAVGRDKSSVVGSRTSRRYLPTPSKVLGRRHIAVVTMTIQAPHWVHHHDS